jgi:hypothetical protein
MDIAFIYIALFTREEAGHACQGQAIARILDLHQDSISVENEDPFVNEK